MTENQTLDTSEVVQESPDSSRMFTGYSEPPAALPPNVTAFKDQYGKTRYRYRKRGAPSRSIPGWPGTEQFEKAYASAVAGQRMPPRQRAPAHPNEEKRRLFVRFCERAFKSCRARACGRGLSFNLTIDHIEEVLTGQGWRCAVSGLELVPTPIKDRNPFGPSVDRINPILGYTKGNIRIVCRIVNFAMSDWGVKPLHRLIKHMKTPPDLA